MGLLMVVLSLIFMSDHVITECKYKNRLHPFVSLQYVNAHIDEVPPPPPSKPSELPSPGNRNKNDAVEIAVQQQSSTKNTDRSSYQPTLRGEVFFWHGC